MMGSKSARHTLEWIQGRVHWLALTFILGFVVLGAVTLPKYGLTWDEGLGNLFFGERYCHYFATLDPAYLDFQKTDLAIHQRPFNLALSPFRHRPYEFPPLADTVSAAAMELLAYRLPWLDPVDAFHLPKILLCGLLLWVLFAFARRRFGPWTALGAVVLLASYPRFWGDMHFNPKDVPETVFFSLTIIALVAWWRQPSWKRALGAGLGWGCALATKANAAFVPVILLLAAVPWRLRPWPGSGTWTHARRYAGHYALMVASALAVHVATWPYLFANPWRLFSYYSYINTRARGGTVGWNWDALWQTFATMPEVMVALFLMGIVLAIRLRHSANGALLRLLVVWAAVPILRTSLPGTINFDGIRHFQEFLPPACLLAAIATSFIIAWLGQRWPARRWLGVGVVGLIVCANLAWIVARYAPYEHLYFNSLVGGLAGANRKYAIPEATDYWASSYRDGIRWLNGAADHNAVVHVAVAPWLVQMTAPIWLRPDIEVLLPEPVPPLVLPDRSVYVMFVTRTGWYTDIAKYCVQNLSPIHQVLVDGFPVLQIYRLARRVRELGDPP
jgi:4-amino-4-deoxy-L-arabinose transferase-like glycosyltransferase